MSITPKNWDSFQHYKDRSPIWIKLHRKLLDDYAFSRLPIASKALAPMLWLLASEYEGGTITATNEEIAFRLRISDDELISGLNPLIEAGFFASDSKPLARRKRAAIPEKRHIENIEKTETDTRTVAKATRPKSSEAFEEFWKAYPRRLGANPKAPASKVFDAALKQGADPAAIVAGAQRCAAADHDKIGTPYIPQAVKWLRDQRWLDYAAEPLGASGLSEAERKSMFEKLRKPNGLSAGTDLRSVGPGSRESDGEGRQEPATVADHQAKHAGMGGVDAVFREPLGVRAIRDEAGSGGNEQGIYRPRTMAG